MRTLLRGSIFSVMAAAIMLASSSNSYAGWRHSCCTSYCCSPCCVVYCEAPVTTAAPKCEEKKDCADGIPVGIPYKQVKGAYFDCCFSVWVEALVMVPANQAEVGVSTLGYIPKVGSVRLWITEVPKFPKVGPPSIPNTSGGGTNPNIGTNVPPPNPVNIGGGGSVPVMKVVPGPGGTGPTGN